MNAWALFNNYNTYQMLLCQRYCITQRTEYTMLNSMLKIFVGPVMGGGVEPPPTHPPVNTPLWLDIYSFYKIERFHKLFKNNCVLRSLY
jgi:hypothetical protein